MKHDKIKKLNAFLTLGKSAKASYRQIYDRKALANMTLFSCSGKRIKRFLTVKVAFYE